MAVSVIVLYNCQGLAFSSRKAKMFRKVLWLIPGVDSFSLFYGLLSGLGSLLRMFCFLCFTSAVSDQFNLRSGSLFVSLFK